MSIFQFIWQIILICGLVIGLAIGLFSAPWYVLAGILIATFLFTWRLMPNSETHLSEFVDTFNGLQQAHGQVSQPTSIPSAIPDAAVVNSDQPGSIPLANDAAPPTVLSYRGAPYAVKPQSPEPSTDATATDAINSSGLPELKYRGAKVRPKPQQQ